MGLLIRKAQNCLNQQNELASLKSYSTNCDCIHDQDKTVFNEIFNELFDTLLFNSWIALAPILILKPRQLDACFYMKYETMAQF